MPLSRTPEWEIQQLGSDAVLSLSGDWLVRESGLRSGDEVRGVLEAVGKCTRLRFDTRLVMRWDSALVAFIRALQAAGIVSGRRIDMDVAGLPEALGRLLALAQADHGMDAAEVHRPRISVARRAGIWVITLWTRAVASAALIGITVLGVLPRRQKSRRTISTDLVALMQEAGAGALGIITVVNGLVGAILAFVGAVQLQRFGAGIFVANLVGVAVIREMAAIMTGIVMAGRTGGAYAAEIANMQGNEEIDALQTFGISPGQYLVVPRVTALVAMMPVLYFYACLVGVAGGLAVSLAMLSMSPRVFLDQLRSAVDPAEFYIGLAKSICFGALIAISSCRIGLSAGRSAADVGRAATDAVVTGIIGIITLDAIFAACANVLGL